MTEPTPEQKAKTIRLARVMHKNMLEQQLLPALKEYVEWQREYRALHLGPAKPQPAEPQEDPAEQQRLRDVLATVKNQNKGETK